MCLKYWTRSLIWNCPLNPTVPTTNPDNMGPLRCSCHENSRFWSSCSTASESFARQRWTCVLVFSKFNLMSVGKKKTSHGQQKYTNAHIMSHVLSCRWCFYVCWSAVRPVQGLLGGVGFCSSLLGVSENGLRFTAHMAIHQKMMRQWWETRPLENRWVGLFSDKPILGLVASEHFTSRCWMSLGNKLVQAEHPIRWFGVWKCRVCQKNMATQITSNHIKSRMLQAHWLIFPLNIITSVWWSQQSRARLSTLRHDLDLGATSKKALLPTDDRWSCVCCFQSQGPILRIRCLIKMEMGEEWWVIAYLMIVMIYYMYNSR